MDLHLPTFIREAFPKGTQGLTDAGFKAALARRGLSMGRETRREDRKDGAWMVGLVSSSSSPNSELQTPNSGPEAPRG